MTMRTTPVPPVLLTLLLGALRPGRQLSLQQEHSRTAIRKVGLEGVDSAGYD